MFTHVKKAGGNVSFLSNAMVTRSDEARSLDAEIRRQTSFKALKRNESCRNKEIIKKVCFCDHICKSSPDGVFQEFMSPTYQTFLFFPHQVRCGGFLQATAVDINITHLEMFCIIQIGLKRTYS